VVSGQPTRKMVKEFKVAGWTSLRTDGSHTVCACSCGKHTFSLPDGHRTISPGVVRKARNISTEGKETTR
jgi:predicted RNA binding protein YcfA (HicA-like mRNA interferase family)